MERNVWKIPINEETSDEDLERCVLAASRTSDTNVQAVAAKATVEKARRQDKSELTTAKKRIDELEGLVSQLQSGIADSGSNSIWLRWQTVSGWVAAIAAIIALFII